MTPPNIDFTNLKAVLDNQNREELAYLLAPLNPATIARFIEELELQQQVQVVTILENRTQTEVVSQLDTEVRTAIFETLDEDQIKKLIEKMPHDERVDLLKGLDPEKRRKIMQKVSANEKEDIIRLSNYEEGSTGAIMTSDYALLEENMSVDQAIEKLRIDAPDKETIYYAYIVDKDRKLVGSVSLRSLITANHTGTITDLMTTDLIQASANDPDHETAQKLKESDLIAVPVVDDEERLVGIVTFDDAMQVLEEDTTATMYQKVGISAERDAEREKDITNSAKLLKGSIWYPVRLRIMFLFVTLIGGFLVGGLIDFFEDVLEAILVAAVFIPVIMDMGGNVGTQSSTIFARGLALGHIDTSKIWRHIGREMSIGAFMGMALGVIGGLTAYYWQGIPNNVPEIGLAVGISLAIVVVVATILGFLLPYIMLKLGFDHAPGADPFITTIKDFTGLGLYFILVGTLIGV